MFGFKKDAKYLAERKSKALDVFYVAQKQLNGVLADIANYGFEIEDRIEALEKERKLLDKEYKSTSKILDKIDEFLG
jgi:hypothetical protein